MQISEKQAVYKSVDGIDLNLRIFEPSGHGGTPLPAIVFFHGGGWIGGEYQQFFQQARYLARKGMFAASAEYRLIEEHGTTPFECVKDGRSCMRWLRANAGDLGIDVRRVAAGGGSAGAHVALCAALLENLDESTDDPDVNCRPDALVLFNPVVDTTATGWIQGQRMLGRRDRELSPVHHVKKGAPPAMIVHGTADASVPFENAERFCRRMKEEGNTCKLIPYSGEGHGFFNRGRDNGEDVFLRTVQDAEDFLISHDFLA
jgi:acetyl esterase/lipase